MEDKRKNRKYYIIGGIVLWLFFLHYMINVYCAMEEEGVSSFFSGLGLGLSRMLSLRGFKVFPVPGRAITTTLLLTVVFAVVYLMIWSNQKMRRHVDQDTALADAKYLTGKELENYNSKFTEPIGKPTTKGFGNIILGQDFCQSMDNQATGRNCNVITIAGSGRGKSFRYVGPNLLQANASFIVTDPSGDLFRQYGRFFEHKGYKVKCFNLAKMHLSNHYNPFNYIHSDKDIMVLVDVLIANTTPPNSHSGDPFWEKAEAALFNAIIAYQFHYMEPEFRNFSTTLNMIRMGNVSEEGGGDEENKLGQMFEEKRAEDPNGFAFKQYGNFIMGAGKTIKSILVSCAFRIKAFDLEDLYELTKEDDIDLDSIGDEKTVIFIIIPTGEKTFNFLAALLYSQLFIRLYDYCETTAVFSQVVKDEKGELIRTFRANDPEDMKRAKAEAERFAKEIKKAVIVENPQMDWYELRTPKVINEDGSESGDDFIAYRKTYEEAEEAARDFKTAVVTKNGNHLPIHTRMMLDEFANIGSIPDFDTKVSTIRKYSISVNIILQSLKQLQKTYEKEWDTLTSNCDNIIYMGGGADTETTKWLSELIGKETRQVAGHSFQTNTSGSTNINAQAVELMAAYQLRTLKDKELIVLPVGLPVYRGKMYNTPEHPNWKYVKNADPYVFDQQKTDYFIAEEMRSSFGKKRNEEEAHGGVNEEESERKTEAVNRVRKQQAEEFSAGKDVNGEPLLGAADIIDAAKNTMGEQFGLNSSKDVRKAAESLITLNRDIGKIYTIYDKEPVDVRRKRAAGM